MTKSYKRPHRLRDSVVSKPSRVDFEKGMIYGVKAIAEDSRNGFVYPRETRVKAHRLLEGLKVNIDHLAKRGKGQDVPLVARFGKLVNVREGAGGTFADLKFNVKHRLAESIAYAADELPDTLGLSMNAVGRGSVKDTRGRVIIDEFTKFNSFDLVADPASTHSLFESTMEPEIDPAVEGIKAEVIAIMDSAGDRGDDEGAIIAALEEFCVRRKGAEEVQVTLQESLTPEAEVVRLKAEKDCIRLCDSMKVPVTLDLVETLADLPTDEKRKKLLAQLKKTATPATKTKSAQVLRDSVPGGGGAPQPEEPKAERARLTALLRNGN